MVPLPRISEFGFATHAIHSLIQPDGIQPEHDGDSPSSTFGGFLDTEHPSTEFIGDKNIASTLLPSLANETKAQDRCQ